MSFFWESEEEQIFKTAVKNFKDALIHISEETSWLSYGHISDRDIDQKNKTVIKGRNFLIGIHELMTAELRTKYQFWTDFLNAATKAVNTPHIDNYTRLHWCQSSLKLEWENGNPWNKAVPGVKVVAGSFFVTAGAGGVVLSSMYLHWIIWGSLSLAMGPWIAVGLGVCGALLSAIVACIAAYQIYKNVKICNDTPIRAITDFVEHVRRDQGLNFNVSKKDSNDSSGDDSETDYTDYSASYSQAYTSTSNSR